MNATRRLAGYAVGLSYRSIPSEVIERAKACILDTLAVSLYGSTKPWSRAVSGFVRGAAAFLPAFAMAEEKKVGGKALLGAFVAACEVMSRIGVAAGNSLERRGFHAPGLTGTFGAAVAAGRLLGLNERQMVNALGI